MPKPIIVAVVQARMGSSRLPGKSLLSLNQRPLITHVLDRVLAVRGLSKVVLATSYLVTDDALAAQAEAYNGAVEVVRGSEWDVLDRFRLAATATAADVIMRVTGDCPFLCPLTAAEVLAAFHDNPLRVDYVSNDTTCSGFPDGTDVEVFSRAALDAAVVRATARPEREHVTTWMRRSMTTGTVKAPEDWSVHKLSVDRPEDYALAARLANALTPGDFSLAHTIAVLGRLTLEESR